MEVLLPTIPLDSSTLSECRVDVQFDDFFFAKLAYINCKSDLDVFQLQGNERIQHLICAWETALLISRRCDAECRSLPAFLQNYLVNLVHYSMGIWFSLEWEQCDYKLCTSLLVSMFRMRRKLMNIPALAKINWKYIFNIGPRPWHGTYFKEYMRACVSSRKNPTNPPLTLSVETVEAPATIYDIAHIKDEGLVITLLRLMKLFDAGCMESVKRFSICALSAWNQEQQKTIEESSSSSHVNYDIDVKRCLNMICHTHLMAVFERDTAVGFEIDNMINSIRFYHKCILDAQADGKTFNTDARQVHITPSRLIAITCVRLNQSVQELIESVLPDLSRESCSTLFGAVSHSYATYLLASILVEMNKFNQEDFVANVDKYKETMRAYVVERERSERFILEEVHKQKLQGTSHNLTCTVRELTNLKTAIGKGNHSSNLVNHKPSDVQSQQEREELFETENEKRYDPVFQTMPNNEIVTNEFYDVLSKTKYKGWHFAKLVLLLKIIERELNDIEKWCYHPGLTTQFMMSLEHRLAKRFEALALIFQDHIFMEQEFWLTAFYLRPVRSYYDKVIYCGTRFFRTVNLLNKGDRDEVILKSSEKSTDKSDEVSCAFMNAKYGLLSSTFDVKQIAQMTSVDTAESDYNSLAKALRTLRLPESIIKDLLTVTFSPRHANFTWAAEWPILRKRCKMLLTNSAYKRELVESNMAEANDRLKYLKVDYDKYKNWPQLDYGTIEEGYENDYIGDDVDESDDEDYYEEDVKTKKGRPRGQHKHFKIDDDSGHAEESNVYVQIHENLIDLDNGGGLKRSSARRAAAVIASAMLKEDYTTKATKKKDDAQKPTATIVSKEENTAAETEKQIEVVSQAGNEFATTSKKMNDLIHFTNSTGGFVPIVDIWAHEKHKKQHTQLSEQGSSQTTATIFKRVSDLCKKFKTDSESDESSGSNIDSLESMHDAMNVSDTETSNSTGERSQDVWKRLLPSFVAENNPLPTSVASGNATDDCETGDRIEETGIISESLRKEGLKSIQTNEAEAKPSIEKSDNVGPSHIIIQSVEVFPATSIAASYSVNQGETKPADSTVSIAPADCTDAVSVSTCVIEVKTNENSKDEEFMVSTTTATMADQGTTDDISQNETEGDIDKVYEPIHEEACIATSTEQSTNHVNQSESEKVEAHSSTQIASQSLNKQLTGKPKSFSAMLAAQLLSEDSSSQSSISTQTQSIRDRDLNSAEFVESDTEKKQKTELIQLCLRKKCYVPLVRTHINTPPTIRQPIVRLKRINLEKFLKERSMEQNRRTKSKPQNFYMEDNSSPVPKMHRLRKRRNFSPQYTESDEEYKPKQAKESGRTSNRRPLSARRVFAAKQSRSRAKSFSVVPRSASGLKVCISSLCHIRSPTDCIEISSSSESDVLEVASFPLEYANVGGLIADEDDPLFEEEADIDLLC